MGEDFVAESRTLSFHFHDRAFAHRAFSFLSDEPDVAEVHIYVWLSSGVGFIRLFPRILGTLFA
jgi:hypothetical protein